jgi:hypothetical protein
MGKSGDFQANEVGKEYMVLSHARLNRTVAAMMQRGIDIVTAKRLQGEGVTLVALKESDDDTLVEHGLSPTMIEALRRGGRSAIPSVNLAQVLWRNRFTCCVCRDPALAIILHHIEPWAESHDHSVENLAVLCLEHHARAHRRGTLEQNLAAKHLREFKENWEREVSYLDPKSILDASRVEGYHWWWFNHVRLFELAARVGIEFQSVPYFYAARRTGKIADDGLLSEFGRDSNYMYEGGDGTAHYFYVRNVLEAVLCQTAVYNISDDLDPGFLGRVISPNDIILVQGRHFFEQKSSVQRGPGQASAVRRQANGVRVKFTIDRWEAVANSTWSTWLVGTQSAASIVRIRSVEKDGDGKLLLNCTGLAVGSSLQGLSTRDYTSPDMPVHRYADDGWLEEGVLDDTPFGTDTET